MHRSGTSAITRFLNLLGAALPSNLMPPVEGNNARGFWESLDFQALNDSILDSAGTSWDDWRPVRQDWFSSPEAEAFRARAAELLAAHFSDAGLFVLKDPRICRLLPFWLDALHRFNTDVKAIIPVRNPLEVAASLEARDAFSRPKSLLLWLRHVVDAELGSRHLARIFVQYDNLLADWRSLAGRISDRLDLGWTSLSSTSELEIDRFLCSSERHHSVEPDAPMTDQEVPKWVADSYGALRILCEDPDTAEPICRLSDAAAEFEQGCDVFGPTLKCTETEAREMAEALFTARKTMIELDDRLSAVEHSMTATHDANGADLAPTRQRIADLEQSAQDQLAILSSLAEIVDDSPEATPSQGRAYDGTALYAQRPDSTHGLQQFLEARLEDLMQRGLEQQALLTDVAEKLEQSQALSAQGLASRTAALEEIRRDMAHLLQSGALSGDSAAHKQQLLEAEEHSRRQAYELAEFRDRASRAEQQVEELQASIQQMARRERETSLRLQDARQKLHRAITSGRMLLTRLNTIQSSVTWQIGDRMLRTEQALPRLTRLGIAAPKILWLLLTAGLPRKLRMSAEAKRVLASGLFDDTLYLWMHPDVAARGFRAIVHWQTRGWLQRRKPHPLFDTEWYISTYMDPYGDPRDPLLHFIEHGIAAGHTPTPLFDPSWYRAQEPAGLEANENPFLHFLRRGGAEGLDPNPWFDSSWYMQQYPDVAASGRNPLVDYIANGVAQGHDPSPQFSTEWYLAAYPDIRDANPLEHFLLHGQFEGRRPRPEPGSDALAQAAQTAQAAQAAQAAHMSEAADVEADDIAPPDWSAYPADDPLPPDRMLVIDWKPPTPDRDSGSYRMNMLIEILREQGYPLDFVGDRQAEDAAYERALEASGIRVAIGRESARRLLATEGQRYRWVWISRPEQIEAYLSMVRAFAPQATVIYDTVDLHWVRLERGVEFSEDPATASETAARYKSIEIAGARSADITIAITETERQRLLAEAPDTRVAVLPNIHRVSHSVSPLTDRRDLFFIGSFHHVPNVDAVLYFINDILPLIHQRMPTVRFVIVGSDLPRNIQRMRSRQIEPVGYVNNVDPFFQAARVFVSPLRHGAGMKGKIGQSLSYGLPVVTTSIGAEGMGLEHEVDAMIADDPQAFAESVMRLLSDDALWTRLSTQGKALLEREYSPAALTERIQAILEPETAG